MATDRFESVTVFGGATLDRVGRTDARPVMGASNPGSVKRAPGGVGFNVATILARLGIRSRLVARVGADQDGETIIAAARAAGVDTNALSVSPSAPTGTYHASLDDAGNLILGIADMKICDEILPQSLATLGIADRERDLWVIDANLPAETIDYLAVEAGATGRTTAALSVSPAKATKLAPVLDRLAYLFTNRREGAVLLGSAPDSAIPVAEIAARLSGSRAACVVVTDGPEPLAFSDGATVRSMAPLRASVKGVNGAGDSFAAGTIAAIAGGLPLADAVRRGLAAAVLTLEAGSVAAARFVPGALGPLHPGEKLAS
jgi:sugar/nucleoside kinase (ribokinase family)